MLHAVVMAGGIGTRFWPKSRRELPKQFLPLASKRSLLQETWDRCLDWIPQERFFVVTNGTLSIETGRQLPQLASDQILIEPSGRNTAPCIALAAIQVLHQDPDGVMLVMPADHVIRPVAEFRKAVEKTLKLLDADPSRLILFGIPPSYPATGYGYIHKGARVENQDDVFQVNAFKEKPNRALAGEYVESGWYYWNCGIFVWKAERILQALAEYEPEIGKQIEILRPLVGTPEFEEALLRCFPKMTSISIDHAVLEKDQSVVVLEAPFEWDDVGSWPAVARHHAADQYGNTVDGAFCGIDTQGCIIQSSGSHLIATIGLENYVVVHTPDATLVAPKNDEERLKKLVAMMELAGYGKHL